MAGLSTNLADGAQPDVAAPEPGPSLLGGYKPERFMPHATWRALLRILSSRAGGTYALSGPRGAGKSWVMDRAGTWAGAHDGLLVSFPSPSEYEPVAFLASISEVVAKRYERYHDELTGATTKAARRRYLARTAAATAMLYGFGAFGILLGGKSRSAENIKAYVTPYTILVWGGAVAGLALLLYSRSEYRKDRGGLRLVRRRAEELRQQVRYAATLKESSEVGLEGKASPLVARLKRASERQLVERPATLSSLIQGFRDFVELMAETIDGPVIIAVDELDKMSDPEKVARLLRDIKGIFDVPGALFLVSLSSEAARNLDLGGVRTRNEFNSSFYTVLDFPPLGPNECVELLKLRRSNFPPDLGYLSGILGAGVPREVVRIAELISAAEEGHDRVGRALGVAFGVEIRAFLEEALAAGQTSDVGDQIRAGEKLALHQALERLALQAPSARLMDAIAAWPLNDQSRAWRVSFQEEWRRLLVRLAVGGVVLSRPDVLQSKDLTQHLQRIVATASVSADVALIELGTFANTVVFGRSTNGDSTKQAEASLAAYLLGQGDTGFRRSDFLRFAAVFDDDTASSALAAFCHEGVLRCRNVRGLARWRSSDQVYTTASG